jgi:hypothetical protein
MDNNYKPLIVENKGLDIEYNKHFGRLQIANYKHLSFL